MWSNVAENNARAAKGEKLRPDYKCKNRQCDGVIWRPKQPAPATGAYDERDAGSPVDESQAYDDDSLPF